MKKAEKPPSKVEVNRNTDSLVRRATDYYMYHNRGELGLKIRNALKAALKATVLGKQTNKQIEKELDKAQYAFNRSLTRATR